MATNKNRIEKLERLEAEIRRRHAEFWAAFSLQELESIRDGDASPEVMAKFEKGNELLALYRVVMTPEERAVLKRIEKELVKREAEILN